MTFFEQSRPHSERLLDGFQGLSLGNLIATLKTWNDARITWRALNNLSDRELNDIGLTRSDIDRVANQGQ